MSCSTSVPGWCMDWVLTSKALECSSEYDTLGTSVKAALVYLGTALVKVGFS